MRQHECNDADKYVFESGDTIMLKRMMMMKVEENLRQFYNLVVLLWSIFLSGMMFYSNKMQCSVESELKIKADQVLV